MEITSGDYTLIHSGIVIQIENLPITVKLPDEVEGDYTFIFNFINDNNAKELITVFNSNDKFTLQIELKNFNHVHNAGSREAVEVGTLKTKPLFLTYRVFDLFNCGKTFIFNFYTKEAKNG